MNTKMMSQFEIMDADMLAYHAFAYLGFEVL